MSPYIHRILPKGVLYSRKYPLTLHAFVRIHDEGFLIQKRHFSESKLFLSFVTKANGRMNGIARYSRKNSLDLGYKCRITWSARLEHQLGFIDHELIQPVSTAVVCGGDYQRLLALQSMAGLLNRLLVEHHSYPQLYRAIEQFVRGLSSEYWLYDYIQFEKILLEQLGFGLDVSVCAVTGRRDNLCYISPKSGRTVSKEAGALYKDKLLPLPRVFHSVEGTDFKEALFVLGYFLEKHLLEGILLPTRQAFTKDLMITAITPF